MRALVLSICLGVVLLVSCEDESGAPGPEWSCSDIDISRSFFTFAQKVWEPTNIDTFVVWNARIDYPADERIECFYSPDEFRLNVHWYVNGSKVNILNQPCPLTGGPIFEATDSLPMNVWQHRSGDIVIVRAGVSIPTAHGPNWEFCEEWADFTAGDVCEASWQDTIIVPARIEITP
jgi:hypothetical protein